MLGTGTALNPFIITSEDDLIEMGNDTTAYYKLYVDIELIQEWVPIPFTGTFDGRGYTVSELEVDATSGADHYGFFSSLSGNADVRNLNLITSALGVRGTGGKYGGVLAGLTSGDVTVRNIVAIGFIDHGNDRGAGLLGYVGGLKSIESTATFVPVPIGGWLNAIISNTASGIPIGFSANAGVWSSEYSGNDSPGGNVTAVDLTIAEAANPDSYPSYFDFEFEWEIAEDGLPRVRKLDEVLIVGEDQTQWTKVEGIVQIDGAPAKREIRAFGYYETTYAINTKSVNQSQSLGQAISDPVTGEYLIDLFWGYDGEVFVVAFDDYGEEFTADRALVVGDRIRPAPANGYVWEATGAGSLPSDEPIWEVDTESSRLYGTVSMIAVPFYRPMVHGPVLPALYTPILSDEYFQYVVLLLNMDQVGGTDPLRDFSPLQNTPVINNALTAQPGKFGNSLSFNGTNADVTLPGTGFDYDIYPGQDFTIELFVKRTTTGSGVIFGKSNGGSDSCYSIRFSTGSISWTCYTTGRGSSGVSLSTAINGQLDAWHHIAVARQGNQTRLFFDGQMVKAGVVSNPYQMANRNLRVGQLGYPGYPYWHEGGIDSVRFTKGVARYVETFDPQTKAFPTSGPE
jgi:hypothetical protein